MKIFMYDDFPNYGDVLNLYIWPLYFKDFLDRPDDILMFGIGTLLGRKSNHKGQIIVCGSGCGYEANVSSDTGYKIFFVRGPNSARMLGLSPEVAVTDPAILVDECFPPAPSTGRVVFMPHCETSRNPLWRRACALADIDYVDPLADVATVSAQLSSAKLVITEAMHGAIVADAYRVPWLAVSTSMRVNLFKWDDWAASLDLRPALHILTPLGMSDVFRSVTGDYKIGEALRRAMGGNIQVSATVGGQWSRTFNFVYKRLLPNHLRNKIGHQLLWKIGPYIDSTLDRAASKGMGIQGLERTATELSRLANSQGTLSSDAVHAAQKAKVQERLAEVRRYLATTVPHQVA